VTKNSIRVVAEHGRSAKCRTPATTCLPYQICSDPALYDLGERVRPRPRGTCETTRQDGGKVLFWLYFVRGVHTILVQCEVRSGSCSERSVCGRDLVQAAPPCPAELGGLY
jgi:hypothetical protein